MTAVVALSRLPCMQLLLDRPIQGHSAPPNASFIRHIAYHWREIRTNTCNNEAVARDAVLTAVPSASLVSLSLVSFLDFPNDTSYIA